MSVLKAGSTGPAVTELQQRLRELGFDTAGEFGPLTKAAVMAFQNSRGLLPDGKVGSMTRAALESDEPPPAPPAGALAIDRGLRLSQDRYYGELFAKDLIVLHHTAGGSARSTFAWWQQDEKHIATAYIVERNGTIYEVFDPRHWAYHLGLANTGGRVDRRSIGIEMASEGGLRERDGKLYTFDSIRQANQFTGERYDRGARWRGYRYFAAYTAEQTAAAVNLVDYLCETFNIERRTPADHLSFNRDLYEYRGIIAHHQVRKDKSDLHPGFNWQELVERCKLSQA